MTDSQTNRNRFHALVERMSDHAIAGPFLRQFAYLLEGSEAGTFRIGTSRPTIVSLHIPTTTVDASIEGNVLYVGSRHFDMDTLRVAEDSIQQQATGLAFDYEIDGRPVLFTFEYVNGRDSDAAREAVRELIAFSNNQPIVAVTLHGRTHWVPGADVHAFAGPGIDDFGIMFGELRLSAELIGRTLQAPERGAMELMLLDGTDFDIMPESPIGGASLVETCARQNRLIRLRELDKQIDNEGHSGGTAFLGHIIHLIRWSGDIDRCEVQWGDRKSFVALSTIDVADREKCIRIGDLIVDLTRIDVDDRGYVLGWSREQSKRLTVEEAPHHTALAA